MFSALDLDESGSITEQEITEHLDSPAVQDFFLSMDIDATDAHALFKLVDLDGSGVLDLTEFLRGCLRLQGPARATDLLLVTSDFRRAFEQQLEALAILEECLGEVAQVCMAKFGSPTQAQSPMSAGK